MELELQRLVKSGHKSLGERVFQLFEDYAHMQTFTDASIDILFKRVRIYLNAFAKSGDINFSTSALNYFKRFDRYCSKMIPLGAIPTDGDSLMSMTIDALTGYRGGDMSSDELIELSGISKFVSSANGAGISGEYTEKGDVEKIFLFHYKGSNPETSALVCATELFQALEPEAEEIQDIISGLNDLDNIHEFMEHVSGDEELGEELEEYLDESNIFHFLSQPHVEVVAKVVMGEKAKYLKDYVYENTPKFDFLNHYSQAKGLITGGEVIAAHPEINVDIFSALSYRLLSYCYLISTHNKLVASSPQITPSIGLASYLKRHPAMEKEVINSPKIYRAFSN
ncbi:hypothetical protein HN695_05865 [Candidatus Woesearchaeota archaeon]|jgi:hypothetical protein|nr:hypothetical protein [Candidatus Woesearchaeota archaeon]MBT5272593.1 hypothetical protein [Candidatus Woesearchaeota archaeon]MBT6040550.1 hypothetical protein [Candidatus Woesearchaeota archaeon]MBT6337145.1 hypothetical protein [Candidatus Woesearchaeota archaeon]MBT7927835.1 hypothetical protein [Candidatus Woesearchaeota archaeon]